MLLAVDMQSEVPIYIQIRNQIVEGIATGKLSQGEPLPSVRQLASDLGINLHTVNKVYNMLRQEGFLIVHRKSGVVVNSQDGYRADAEFGKKLEESLKPIIAECICRGIDKQEFIRVFGGIYDNIQNSKLRGEFK